MLGWIDYIWFVGEAFHRREGGSGRRRGIADGMLVHGCVPAVADLFPQGGKRLGILSCRRSDPVACPVRFLPFQIHGKTAG